VADLELMPRAGVDYPATWPAFESWFPDDDAWRAYLAKLRWPDGFVCPACRAGDAWETDRGLWMCRGCGRQTSVTAGTIFHRTRYPLRTWFAAAWFVCSQKTGASALGLQRVLGFGSYETAWTWMHKLRRAMVRPDRDQLGGLGKAVELDQTFVGGRSHGGRRARYETKAEVAIAVERQHPRGLGRIRMRRINSRKDEIFDFALEAITPGTVLYTDGDHLYNDLSDHLDITHEPIVLVHAADPAHDLLPAVHRVASLLKRWLAGTLHYGQSTAHLDYYLDEFTFRFNRRTSRSRGLLFYRLLQQAVQTDPHPLHELVADPRSRPLELSG
jgi:ISXO2-like transposase domain/Transposase zinc-ribbon domain